MICSGVSSAMVASFKETYAPVILRKKAAQRRKETGDLRWWSRYDEKKDFWPLLKGSLSRPFIITFTEPIWCVTRSLVPTLGMSWQCKGQNWTLLS